MLSLNYLSDSARVDSEYSGQALRRRAGQIHVSNFSPLRLRKSPELIWDRVRWCIRGVSVALVFQNCQYLATRDAIFPSQGDSADVVGPKSLSNVARLLVRHFCLMMSVPANYQVRTPSRHIQHIYGVIARFKVGRIPARGIITVMKRKPMAIVVVQIIKYGYRNPVYSLGGSNSLSAVNPITICIPSPNPFPAAGFSNFCALSVIGEEVSRVAINHGEDGDVDLEVCGYHQPRIMKAPPVRCNLNARGIPA